MWALGSGIKGIVILLLANITRTNQLPRFGLKLQEQVIALVRNERFPSTFNCSPLFLQCLWKTTTTENTAGKVSKYGVFFWSVFSRIWTEYGQRSISPCSVRVWGNTDQKKLCIWTLYTQWRKTEILT